MLIGEQLRNPFLAIHLNSHDGVTTNKEKILKSACENEKSNTEKRKIDYDKKRPKWQPEIGEWLNVKEETGQNTLSPLFRVLYKVTGKKRPSTYTLTDSEVAMTPSRHVNKLRSHKGGRNVEL